MTDENIFGQKLKYARQNMGWTQEKLAEKADIPSTSIAHFEAGSRKPSYDNLRKLTTVLNISADYLLGLVDELTIASPVRFAKKLAQMSGDDRILIDEMINMFIKRNQKANLEKNMILEGIIVVDSVSAIELGFTSEAFDPMSYLWRTGNTIIITVIVSKHRGEFRRLINRILELGFDFEIPTPSARMCEIGRKQGWTFCEKDDEQFGGIDIITNKRLI